MPREVYEVFLSSTSKDLQDYRNKVKEMIERFKLATIKMETFGAQETMPFETCRKEVQRCDALIVVVGRRYGWVPAKIEGGDGTKSITWWEVSWALEADKPVYAFLCDETAPLKIESEQDRLLNAKGEKAFIEIGTAVANLKKFRLFLESRTIRDTFVSADDLAAKVTTSLYTWILELAIQKERLAFQKANAAGDKENKPPVTTTMPSVKTSEAPKPVHNFEQVYWQEQIHLTSAACLHIPDEPVGIALIAGRADLKHPSLRNNTSIREIDARSHKSGQHTPDVFTTSLASLLVGNDAGFKGILPGGRLSIFQVLTPQMSTTVSDVLAALSVANLEGNKLICLPLGSIGSTLAEERAHRHFAEKGIIMVCAAGNNSNQGVNYPAAYGYGISVSATDAHNSLAEFSSYGKGVITAAPGVNIPIASNKDGYTKMSGTSYSCAIVSGIVALLLSANKDLSLDEVKKILSTTGQIIYNPKTGKLLEGIRQVNAFKAVKKAFDSASVSAVNIRKPKPSTLHTKSKRTAGKVLRK